MKEEKEEKPRKKVIVEEVASHVNEKPEITLPKDVVQAKQPENVPAGPELPIPESPQKKFNFGLFWIVLPVVFLFVALIGGVFVYMKGVEREKETVPQGTPAPTLEATPTPAPTPEVNLSKFTIAIQNGSGIAGQATKAQNILTSAGFKVVSTGNAKTYDYEKTIIQAKASVDETYLTQLSDLLGKTYALGESKKLSDTAKTDVVVIIGKSRP